ncbi:GNAT family N-acetyltransferase [Ponticaulis sp.]|uniref:GNAT family N-acetyltransferase n=1 Tax=Ponticaulis sp. TaxID=2020902 RepID=UPI000B629117|nr:GNAT family N-acetyltransferase [Ponticaulis sp.]MAI89488.1 hypothetical protein [Ponticaulis sp.]OUY00524.1 MAG: hypothetical protein CBB65_03525 [Hyphomonadaceae bacterium TMED5]|tara:strand:- start:146460 stop:147632 length:1173 start_codon:yes stop_codon:yes gene_type:complete
MSAELLRFGALTETDLSAWRELITTDPGYSSPFFSPTFTHVVSEVRDDVWVIVDRKAGKPVLIWPLQKAGRVAEPVGAPFSDYHGPIVFPEFDACLEDVLKTVGLDCVRMTSVFDYSGQIRPYAREFDGTFVVDLSDGMEAYYELQKSLYPRHTKKMRRISRKIVREVGEVEFNFDSQEQAYWDLLLEWKQSQYLSTGRHNVLKPEWVRQMLSRIWRTGDPECRGYLHTLTHEGRLIAAEFNIGNSSTIHGWVPAYDPEFASYSAGNLLQEFIMPEACARGMTFYDLGVSAAHYKKYYASYQVPVVRATIRANTMRSALSGTGERLWRGVEDAHIPKLSGMAGQIRRRYDVIRSVEPTAKGRWEGVTAAARQMMTSKASDSENVEESSES